MSQTMQLGFSVTGEFLTGHARARVREGAWDRALTFLTDSLDGMTPDLAISILDGSHDLVDDSDGTLSLQATDPAEPEIARYRARLAWQYAGYCVINDRWYAPHAYLANWPRSRAAAVLPSPDDAQLIEAARALGPNPALDHIEIVRTDPQRQPLAVFFTPADTPPLWLQGNLRRTPAAAFEHYRAERGLGDLTELGFDPETRREVDATDALRSRQGSRGSGLLARISAQVDAQRKLEDPDHVANLRRQIADQADKADGWMTLPLTTPPPGQAQAAVRVAKAPFLRWMLRNTEAWDRAPAWTPVAPRDLKMTGDDPCHTDWMLSAGLPLDGWYGEAGEDLRDSAFALAGRLLKSMTGRDAMVLSGSGRVAGPIRHDPTTVRDGDILVLRSADARYLDAVMRACGQGRGGVIVESGGALAHLVQVSRAQNIRIVRLDSARRRLPEGHTALIDCAAGSVRLDP